MTALDYLTGQGFALSVESGGRLLVRPAHRLTADLRHYISHHKPELLTELAANDSAPPIQRAVLNFHLRPQGGGTLIDPDGWVSAINTLWQTYGQRLDLDDLREVLEERAAILEYDGDMQRVEAEREALRLIRQFCETTKG